MMDFNSGDLEEHYELCRREGAHGLRHFVDQVNQKRDLKHRQFEEIGQISRRKSVELDQPEVEQVWAQHARSLIMQSDERLKQLQDEAMKELEDYENGGYNYDNLY